LGLVELVRPQLQLLLVMLEETLVLIQYSAALSQMEVAVAVLELMVSKMDGQVVLEVELGLVEVVVHQSPIRATLVAMEYKLEAH